MPLPSETRTLAELKVDDVIHSERFRNGKREKSPLGFTKPTLVGLSRRCPYPDSDAYDKDRGDCFAFFCITEIDNGWVTARRLIVDREEQEIREDPNGEVIEFCMQGDENVVEKVKYVGRMVRRFEAYLTLQ